MAVAEARAAWQRTANRCFVQEDAKRAPKLACCPSASPPSKQDDVGPASAAHGQDTCTIGFLPVRNPSHSNLSPDSKWWLQLQPNHGCQRGLTSEQISTLEAELETFRTELSSNCEHGRNQSEKEVDFTPSDDKPIVDPIPDTHYRTSATCIKRDSAVRKQELTAIYGKNYQDPIKLKDPGESFELLEMDSVKCSVSKQPNELSFDPKSPWVGGEKAEPWWRTADREELALLVAQRSLDLIENCDLPQPQNTYVKKDSFAQVRRFDTLGEFISGSACEKQEASVKSYQHSFVDKPISSSDRSSKVTSETQISDRDPSKAELLEALCHSQTRAREAEKAAEQAYAEKEHIVKLVFRQASQLFAYEQWFQLLQLENLYYQMKDNKNQPISALSPTVAFPWMPHINRKSRVSWQKASTGKQPKRGRPRCDICRLAVAFALGLSLVGAGLLLGWTVGWMLPTL